VRKHLQHATIQPRDTKSVAAAAAPPPLLVPPIARAHHSNDGTQHNVPCGHSQAGGAAATHSNASAPLPCAMLLSPHPPPFSSMPSMPSCTSGAFAAAAAAATEAERGPAWQQLGAAPATAQPAVDARTQHLQQQLADAQARIAELQAQMAGAGAASQSLSQVHSCAGPQGTVPQSSPQTEEACTPSRHAAGAGMTALPTSGPHLRYKSEEEDCTWIVN
jgi:hypothetical protein